MANDVQKFFAGHQQPKRSDLAAALNSFSANKNALLGKALLKLTKQGTWVAGVDNEVLPAGTVLIVNPSSMSSGYIAWYQSKIEGEVMQPLSMGPVDPAKLGPVNSGKCPPGKSVPSGRGWEPQSSIDAITQTDVPLNLVYKSSSLGGMKVLLDLAGDIVMGFAENPKRAFPLVELGVDSYTHKEYGLVYTPQLSIVGWLDEEGNELTELNKLAGPGKGRSLL